MTRTLHRGDLRGPVTGHRDRMTLDMVLPRVVEAARTSTTNGSPVLTSVTPSATTNTKGAWAELIAATAFDADVILLQFDSTQATATSPAWLLDIGIGAAAAETVLVANLQVGGAATVATTTYWATIAVPVHIPKGSRVSVRCQAVGASRPAMRVAAVMYAWDQRLGIQSPKSVDTIGADTSDSGGVTLTSNAWVEMTAATARAYQGLVVTFGSTDATSNAPTWAVDIAVGAGGSEVQLAAMPDIMSTTTAEHIGRTPGFVTGFLPCRIPKGARIAARLVGAAGDTWDITLVGIPA